MAIDLFASLNEIGKKRNLQWYSNLSEEDQKTAHPFVIGRWLTGTSDPAQIVRINQFVNPYMFALGKDKDLLFSLLAAACTGSTARYRWIKGPASGGSSALSVKAISDYYEVTLREATRYLQNTSHDTIIEMAEELGWDKEAMTKLKKELGNGSGSTEKSSSKSKGGKRK